MATHFNQSPAVTILEKDLSLRAQLNVGTNVFVPGFANQGPTDEVLTISTRDELESVYGTPTNSAERYFYYTVRELLLSPASIYTFRLPYGSGTGAGFGSTYSALVYPAQNYTNGALTTNLDSVSGTYLLGEPVHVDLNEDQYRQALEGTLFDWSSTATSISALATLSSFGGAGLIILNKAQTTINSQFEGYYVAIADNTNINPATTFNSIVGAKSLSLTGSATGAGYTSIPTGTLQFNLSAPVNGAVNSISQIMESLTNYNIDGREDDDLLNIGVFKLRKSVYSNEAFKLDYVLSDALVGSIDSFRTQLNSSGGPAVPFFLESVDNNSVNVEILVNPYVSNKYTQSSLNPSGIPQKKIRVYTGNLSAATVAAIGIPLNVLSATNLTTADNLYPVGSYSNTVIKQKTLGSIPSKISRALDMVSNDEIYDIDVVAEAGLGTVFAISNANSTTYYDDTYFDGALKVKLDALRTSNDLVDSSIRDDYTTIFNTFENFCNLPSNTGGRGDCIFVADPIRQTLITGVGTKILSDKSKNFQTDVYWAMRHQSELANSSYAAFYGNWVKVYDEFTGGYVWIPFSGFASATYARGDANGFPWDAPAGFNRGLVTTLAVDLAINPNQKQRDILYQSNINPVMISPVNGMVIFGQKTLSRKPSAFDRINVRRLFQALERPTKKVSQYFLFEPNNEFTQTRFYNTLKPLFEYAKNNGGIYDYLLVTDGRVNTPDVIDSNELKATVLIKPVKTAEWVTVEFVATTTGASFAELI